MAKGLPFDICGGESDAGVEPSVQRIGSGAFSLAGTWPSVEERSANDKTIAVHPVGSMYSAITADLRICSRVGRHQRVAELQRIQRRTLA